MPAKLNLKNFQFRVQVGWDASDTFLYFNDIAIKLIRKEDESFFRELVEELNDDISDTIDGYNTYLEERDSENTCSDVQKTPKSRRKNTSVVRTRGRISTRRSKGH